MSAQSHPAARVASRIEIADGIDDFVAQPFGRAVLESSWLYVFPHPGFCAFVLWGQPHSDELARLRFVGERMLSPHIPPHVCLSDIHGIEQATTQAFATLTSYEIDCRPGIREKIRSIAVVKPPGVLGVAAEGLSRLIATPHPVGFFESRVAALEWLGQDLAYADQLDALQVRATNTPGIVRDLSAILGASLREADLAWAARELKMSPRVLQRQLRLAGTSFRQQLHLAQVRAAEKLLLETEESVTTIAYAVGCATHAHFSELFRRVRGETPSGWRARHTARDKSS